MIWLVSYMTRGVKKMISSVRDELELLAPKAAPKMGIRCKTGTPPELSVRFSVMMPPIATVSPSSTVN